MTSPLEQPPAVPSLVEFTDAVRAGDDPRIHGLAIAMLEFHFDTSLRDQPELWRPDGRYRTSLEQVCKHQDGITSEYSLAAGSSVEVSQHHPSRRRYSVEFYSTLEGADYRHTAEWGKGDSSMMLARRVGNTACGSSHRLMSSDLVNMTVMHAHPELTDIVPPTGLRATLRWIWLRGMRTLYLGQSRFPGMIHPYPDPDK